MMGNGDEIEDGDVSGEGGEGASPIVTCRNCGFDVNILEIPGDRLFLLKGTLGFKCPSCDRKNLVKSKDIGNDLYNSLRAKVRLGGNKREERRNMRVERTFEDRVYKTATTARDIIYEVITSRWLGLSEAQIDEFMSIVDDYGGFLSPSDLERILATFDKVTKEKAKVARARYEMKLQREYENLPVSVAEQLNLFPRQGTGPRQYGITQGSLNPEEIGDIVRRAISSTVEERSRRDAYAEHVAPAIGKALSNIADTTGLLNRIINRVVLTAFEEQVRRDPYVIGDIRKWLPALSRGAREEEREVREKEKSYFEFEETRKKRREESIFAGLDEFFEEE